MPWKQELMCVTVLVTILSSKSVAMNFCTGNGQVRTVFLVYRNTTKYKHCVCHVHHLKPDSSNNYIVRSEVLKGLSDTDGGYYNLSFIHEGKTESIVNQTLGRNKKMFTSPQTIVSNITLKLRDDVRRPKVLTIKLFSGDRFRIRELKIKCVHIPSVDITETTYVTTTTSSHQPRSTKPSQTPTPTIPTSTVWDELSSTSQTPTRTVTAQVLPSTADKETDRTIVVVGGVIGVLLCIVVAVVVGIFILRRRNRRNKDEAASRTSHDNPMYGARPPVVIYDVATNLTDKAHDALNLSSDYVENEVNSSGRPRIDEYENCNRKEEVDDCYNHTNIAADAQNRSRGNIYVNVAATTRMDYDHIKPSNGLPPGPSSHLSDKDEDTYNHTGQIHFLDPENCYNHLGQVSAPEGANLDDCYNHVGQIPSQETTNSEDCYNHLGQ